MPRKKYSTQFPPARIKKIMQADEEIGRMSKAVPVIISRMLELFLKSLLNTASQVTRSRKARTMTISHLKHCFEQEKQFEFLRDLVALAPDTRGPLGERHRDKSVFGGRKPGRGGWKNVYLGSQGKDKELLETASQKEAESEDTDAQAYEMHQVPPQVSFQSTQHPSYPSPQLDSALVPSTYGPLSTKVEDEDYDS